MAQVHWSAEEEEEHFAFILAGQPAKPYLRCLKPCEPSGPSGCLITLLGCLESSGWEILVGLREEGKNTQSG